MVEIAWVQVPLKWKRKGDSLRDAEKDFSLAACSTEKEAMGAKEEKNVVDNCYCSTH